MLKIVIPANMETALDHLVNAGRHVDFDEGVDWAVVGGTGEKVIRLRSSDIPLEVEDSCDVGLCGSDWVEERKLELGTNLEVLSEYAYGRRFDTQPSLDIVVKTSDPLSNIRDVKPGSMFLTEHPFVTRQFLEGALQERGLRVVQLRKDGLIPTIPGEFRKWCQREGAVGIRTVHGRIAALVNLDAGCGVMVNETGLTLARNELRILETVHPIRTLLIADRDALRDNTRGPEIEALHRDLDRAYLRINGESEASFSLGRERIHP